MKISARNCLEGKVVSIKKGPVSTEVTLETASGEKIVSSITTASAESLGLDVGVKAFAVIKASNVMVAVEKVLFRRLLPRGDRIGAGSALLSRLFYDLSSFPRET